ncbi:MAG: LuxR C-terminal-related transcriptional regulator [Rhodospirillaceae bacterium]|nr:LuxR C-terminal-related transcriptional regulator [Rhodospirillaceae bacterium]
MSQQEPFDRIVAALHDAALDDSGWSATAALIDDACRTKGNILVYGDGQAQDEAEIYMARFCYRGQRDRDMEREYFDVYHARDERMPRLRRLPDGQLVHIRTLYTDQEVKSSAAYNEALPRSHTQNSLNVRLDGPDGSRIVWVLADSIDAGEWSPAQTGLIQRLLPHLRQFVRVRHTLVEAGALGASLGGLLDNSRSGVIQLDRRGRIVAANDRARSLLRRGDGVFDQSGSLNARAPADNAELQRLLARALPRFGGQGVGGSMLVRRPFDQPRLVLHVSPVADGETDIRARRVAALVLIVDPASRTRIDPALVAATLELTPMESRVAVWLAEGKTVRNIAQALGRTENTVRWHMKNIFNKHHISRQFELAQLVLALAGLPEPRRP